MSLVVAAPGVIVIAPFVDGTETACDPTAVRASAWVIPVVPITLMRHYVRLFDVPYVRDQVYLNPHPKELMLRNHV